MSLFTYLIVQIIRYFAFVFYRREVRWIGNPPADPWAGLRLIAILNHTSLYEPLFASVTPERFVRRFARHAVIPVADKTMQRPLVGRFFRKLAPHVVSITRKRDETWSQVLEHVNDPKAMVIILPEGRMKRASGLDLWGKPMTIKAGIAELIRAIPEGRMLLAYSGGLHHIQHPGEHLPRLFKTLRINLENLDLAEYRRRLLEEHGEEGFVDAVRQDLERRRNENCPPEEEVPRSSRQEVAR